MRNTFTIGLVALAIWAGSCSRPSFVEVREDRSQLLDDFQSYATVAEIREMYPHLVLKWRVVSDRALSPGDRRPPYHHYSVVVPEYEHLGHKGALTLAFFNNRLMATMFVPLEYDTYVVRLQEAFPELRHATSARWSSFTTVRTGVHGLTGEKYAEWADDRLVSERDLWIKRYS
jgi:hypothetical protein